MDKRWNHSGDYRNEIQSDVESAVKEHIYAEMLNNDDWRADEALQAELESLAESTTMNVMDALQVMEFTSNDNAYYDENREWSRVDDWFALLTAVATAAYAQDLKDYLRDMSEESVMNIIDAIQCEECNTWREAIEPMCEVCDEEEEEEEEVEGES